METNPELRTSRHFTVSIITIDVKENKMIKKKKIAILSRKKL